MQSIRTSAHNACADVAGAGGEIAVFILIKRGDSIYTAIVQNAGKAALQAVVRRKANLDSVVHTDHWAGCHGLVELGFDKHLRVEHRDNIFVRQLNPINGSRASGALPNDASPASAVCPNMTSYLT